MGEPPTVLPFHVPFRFSEKARNPSRYTSMPRWRLGRVVNVTICQASSLKEKPSASGGGVSPWSQIALWSEPP